MSYEPLGYGNRWYDRVFWRRYDRAFRKRRLGTIIGGGGIVAFAIIHYFR